MVLTQDTEAELQLLLAQNRKIEAIKLVHDTAKCGLKEAKDFVDGFTPGRGVPVARVPSGDMDARIMQLLLQGKKIDAVKLYKEATGSGLAESKDYVDNLQQGGASFAKPPSNKRDTAIDQIMEQQSQSRVLVQVSSGVSPIRVILLLLALIAIVGLLMYLFVAA